MHKWVCSASPLRHHRQKARLMRPIALNHRLADLLSVKPESAFALGECLSAGLR